MDRILLGLLLMVCFGLFMASIYTLDNWPIPIKRDRIITNDPVIVNEFFDLKGATFV